MLKSIYPALSRVKLLSGNYALKFLFIAFLGIHIPLLGVIAVLLSGSPSALVIFIVTLLCTLLACGLTLYVLKGLLEPLHSSYIALKNYLYNKELPHLPMQYPDEAGLLMRKTQLTLQQLDKLLKEKQELAMLLSHDLRAPLNNIAGLAQLIQEEEDADVIYAMAGKLMDQAAGQLRFVDNIVAKMRLEDRIDEPLNIEEVDFRELVQQVTDSISSQLQAKKISVKNQIEPGLLVGLDKEQIIHVLQNLLTNAIKFSRPGGLIEVDADQHNDQIRIDIRDEGMGFDTETGAQLFNRYTAGQPGTHGEKSTGIGLYLANKIMQQHNGKILADSPGREKGAVFSLIFQVNQEQFKFRTINRI